MVHDCINLVKRYETCQLHANFIHQPPEPIHQPPEPIHPTIASLPFEAWRLDVIGSFTPKSSVMNMYIFVTNDYFSKWAEVNALKEVKKESTVYFVSTHSIC